MLSHPYSHARTRRSTLGRFPSILFAALTIVAGLQLCGRSESLIGQTRGKDQSKEEKENNRVKVPTWKLGNIFKEEGVHDLRHVTETVEHGANGEKKTITEEGLERARASVGDVIKNIKLDGLDTSQVQKLATTPEHIDAVARLFQLHSFEEIEKAAKGKKLPLDLPAADLIGRIRRQMINQAMSGALQTFDPEKKFGLTIGMLDSGNKNSGIASDVDQTVFLVPRGDPPGNPSEELKKAMDAFKVTNESELIKKVVEHFDAKFEDLWKVKPSRLGIECMNGADFFPDWRGKHTVGQFEIEVDRVVGEKRANPEAYRSEGQLKSQAEGRGYEALRDHSERVEHLERLEDELKKIGPAEQNAKIQAFIEQYKTKKEFANINFDPANPQASLERLKAEFERHAPWTEIGYDKTTPDGPPKVVHLSDTRQKVLRLPPEMARRFAFDGAWDNWLMFDHHPGNRPKYLLRSFAEGISMLRQVQGGKEIKPLEYESLYKKFAETGDPKPLNDVLRELYRGSGGDSPSDAELKTLRNTMDIAAKARLLHKNELPGVDAKKLSPLELEAKLYEEFMPPKSDAEKLYGITPEVLQKARVEAAKKAWSVRARATMIDNLQRTIRISGKAWEAGITAKELAALKEKGFDEPTREKQKAAVEKSLFHGFHDLLGCTDSGRNTFAFARALLEADPKKKAELMEQARTEGDLALKMLDELRAKGGESLVRKAEWIMRDAAIARLSAEPDSALRTERFRDSAYYERVLDVLKKLPISEDTYRRYVADFESGKYTPEAVAQRMLHEGTERVATAAVEMARALGGDIKNVHIYWPVLAENKFPNVEIEWGESKFSGKQAVTNLFTSAGNYDSALQVIYEYQMNGPEAAKWALAREMFFNVPYVAQGAAIYDFLKTGNPRGVVMLGSAMYVPVLGQAYIVVSITTTGVTIIGNYYLLPLKDDLISKTYMGYIPKEEAGFFRAGWKEDELSRRETILHRVKLDVQPDVVRDEDGTPITNQEGKPIPVYEVARISKEKAFDLGFIESTVNDDYEYLVENGLVGGGPKWAELKAKSEQDHRARFESQRTGMFYHYEQALIRFLRTAIPESEGDLYTVHEGLAGEWLELDEPRELGPQLLTFFGQVVRDWIVAEGEYAGLDENVLLDTKFDHIMRRKLAGTMTSDLLRSYQILRDAPYAQEKRLRSECQNALQQRRVFEANQRAFALFDAHTAEQPGEFETLAAMGQVSSMRKNAARNPAPRVHVRPRVVLQKTASEEKPREVVQLLVSVIANDDKEFTAPGEVKHPGPFSCKQKSYVEQGKMIVELAVYDANGQLVAPATAQTIARVDPAGTSNRTRPDVSRPAKPTGRELPYSWRGAIGTVKAEEDDPNFAGAQIISSGPTRYGASNHSYEDVERGKNQYADISPYTWIRFRTKDLANLKENGPSLHFQRQIASSPNGPWWDIGEGASVRLRDAKEKPKANEHPRFVTTSYLWKDPKNDDEFVLWSHNHLDGLELDESKKQKGVGAIIRLGSSGWSEDEYHLGAYFRVVQVSGRPGLFGSLGSPVGRVRGAVASKPVAPTFDIYRFGSPGDEIESFGTMRLMIMLGGANHGSLEPFQKFTATFMGRTRAFWSDGVGIGRFELPGVPVGKTESLVIEAEHRGNKYTRNFAILGNSHENQILSRIDAENQYRRTARRLQALVGKEAPTVSGTLAPVQAAQKEVSDLWVASMNQREQMKEFEKRAEQRYAQVVGFTSDKPGQTPAQKQAERDRISANLKVWDEKHKPQIQADREKLSAKLRELDENYKQKNENLSKLERQIDDYQAKLQKEVDDIRNEANTALSQLSQAKDNDADAKAKVREVGERYKSASEKLTQLQTQRMLMAIASDRAEQERQKQGKAVFAAPAGGAAFRARTILDAFQDAASAALATYRWSELDSLLKGWQRALDQASAAPDINKTEKNNFSISYRVNYAGMLRTWAIAMVDQQALRKAIEIQEESRKRHADPNNKSYLARVKADRVNDYLALARMATASSGEGGSGVQYWSRAEALEKELHPNPNSGRIERSVDVTTNYLYPDNTDSVPLVYQERYRPGWWPGAKAAAIDLSQAPMPNLNGMTIDEAKQLLGDMGLTAKSVVGKPAPSTDLAAHVYAAEPKPGTPVGRGTAVQITVYADASAEAKAAEREAATASRDLPDAFGAGGAIFRLQSTEPNADQSFSFRFAWKVISEDKAVATVDLAEFTGNDPDKTELMEQTFGTTGKVSMSAVRKGTTWIVDDPKIKAAYRKFHLALAAAFAGDGANAPIPEIIVHQAEFHLVPDGKDFRVSFVQDVTSPDKDGKPSRAKTMLEKMRAVRL